MAQQCPESICKCLFVCLFDHFCLSIKFDLKFGESEQVIAERTCDTFHAEIPEISPLIDGFSILMLFGFSSTSRVCLPEGHLR